MTTIIESKSGLPFAHLNLRFNPFGELTHEERGILAHVDLGLLPEILQHSHQAVQFVADHGRGKSTHLIALHRSFKNTLFTQLYPGDEPMFSKCALRFVDGVENLSKRRRRLLYRVSESIAITTHHDLSDELSLAGYQVHSVWVSLKDEGMLNIALTRRIEFARRSEGPIPTLSSESIRRLQNSFGDDIRAMESCLYERFQSMKEPGDVEV